MSYLGWVFQLPLKPKVATYRVVIKVRGIKWPRGKRSPWPVLLWSKHWLWMLPVHVCLGVITRASPHNQSTTPLT